MDHPCGIGKNLVSRCAKQRGVASEKAHPKNLVTDLPTCHAFAERCNLACEFEAWGDRVTDKTFGTFVESPTHGAVGIVNACGFDSHGDFACCGCDIGKFLVEKAVVATWLWDHDFVHGAR
jgi:hypothetical protein